MAPSTKTKRYAFKRLKNNGRVLERYIEDLVRMFNYCGGNAYRANSSIDYIFESGSFKAAYDVKEYHCPYTIYYTHQMRDSEVLNAEITELNEIYLQGFHDCGFLIWHALREKTPLLYDFFEVPPYRMLNAFKNEANDAGVNLYNSKPFKAYNLLRHAPLFDEFFKGTPLFQRPYYTNQFPDIRSYEKTSYHAWRIQYDSCADHPAYDGRMTYPDGSLSDVAFITFPENKETSK